ncbi:ABC transporter ATP-binding protein [Symbiobacterium thermophilum]|uniref:ABC transporter n=1 Tax=Symbiobacterium thermophilum TaxID=2734 RepID=A0A953I481_SYMTR|nr:ABC transporter ATP-binding protein [Symbiobacterium thermophilum]MBY6276597.1 ABC transporter [Symbiobacterium thermophilum]
MAITAESVRFGYRGGEVIRGVSFTVPEGAITCLLGRNGSGKTTLIRLVNGILRPHDGSIRIDGMDVLRSPRAAVARRVAFVPQEHQGVFPYGVEELVVMGRNPHLGPVARPGRSDRAAARAAMEAVGIAHLADRDYMQISGGERQLVLIARALTQETPYLLMDEPTSHLDFTNQHAILSIVRRIARERGVGVLVAMHDPNLALAFADRVILLREGRVFQAGPAAEVMTPENLQALYQMPIDVVRLPDGRRLIVTEAR